MSKVVADSVESWRQRFQLLVRKAHKYSVEEPEASLLFARKAAEAALYCAMEQLKAGEVSGKGPSRDRTPTGKRNQEETLWDLFNKAVGSGVVVLRPVKIAIEGLGSTCNPACHEDPSRQVSGMAAAEKALRHLEDLRQLAALSGLRTQREPRSRRVFEITCTHYHQCFEESQSAAQQRSFRLLTRKLRGAGTRGAQASISWGVDAGWHDVRMVASEDGRRVSWRRVRVPLDRGEQRVLNVQLLE